MIEKSGNLSSGRPSIFHARAIAIPRLKPEQWMRPGLNPLDIDIHGRPGDFELQFSPPIEVTSIVQDVCPLSTGTP